MLESDLRLASPPANEPVITGVKAEDLAAGEKRGTLEIARWMLVILASVYALSFALAFLALAYGGLTFENSLEFVKFMIGSVIPLAALVIGYSLGERSRG